MPGVEAQELSPPSSAYRPREGGQRRLLASAAEEKPPILEGVVGLEDAGNGVGHCNTALEVSATFTVWVWGTVAEADGERDRSLVEGAVQEVVDYVDDRLGALREELSALPGRAPELVADLCAALRQEPRYPTTPTSSPTMAPAPPWWEFGGGGGADTTDTATTTRFQTTEASEPAAARSTPLPMPDDEGVSSSTTQVATTTATTSTATTSTSTSTSAGVEVLKGSLVLELRSEEDRRVLESLEGRMALEEALRVSLDVSPEIPVEVTEVGPSEVTSVTRRRLAEAEGVEPTAAAAVKFQLTGKTPEDAADLSERLEILKEGKAVAGGSLLETLTRTLQSRGLQVYVLGVHAFSGESVGSWARSWVPKVEWPTVKIDTKALGIGVAVIVALAVVIGLVLFGGIGEAIWELRERWRTAAELRKSSSEIQLMPNPSANGGGPEDEEEEEEDEEDERLRPQSRFEEEKGKGKDKEKEREM